MSKRSMESGASSAVIKRPKRSCVLKAEKIKLDKAKKLKDEYTSRFYKIVVYYCCFLISLLRKIRYYPTDLSFQRKYDEITSELYSFCERWKSVIELESIYFFNPGQPGLKTSFVYFNYDDSKMFVDQKNMEKLNDERDTFSQIDEIENIQRVDGVCQPKTVDPMLGLHEDFREAVEENKIQERLHAHNRNFVDSEHVRNFPTVKFNKKETVKECTICLGEFKVKSEVFKLQCGQLYHRKCLDEWLEKSIRCPFCMKILS